MSANSASKTTTPRRSKKSFEASDEALAAAELMADPVIDSGREP
jgi:hypothetical protein